MKQFKLTFLLTVLMSMVGAKVYAYDIAVENADGVTIYYNYINDGKELAVTSRSVSYTYTGIVVIPDEVTYMNRTRKVTSISSNAFNECSITSVTIPNSVTSIGNSAFNSCFSLKKVIISDIAAWCGIKFGNDYANPLSYAHHLYSDENTEIKNLVIPNSVTSIGDYTFYACRGLTSVTIPNSVTSIGNSAFCGCSGLTSITIPNSVTSIGSSAFQACKGLTSVTIPNSVTSIGNSAFCGCSGLTSITIPNSVTSIGNYVFDDCKGLTSVTIPNSVTSIGGSAFSDCSGLTSVIIPNSVTSIGGSAFSDCSGLTSVIIPNSVTSIGGSAFFGCSGLTSVTIPNSVTSIGSSAFRDCSGLTSITIGSGVTSIGRMAFDGAYIPIIISHIVNPFVIYGKTTNNRIFTLNTFNNATLYVPKGTIDKYKATEGWKDFYFIEDGTGGGETPPTPQTCEKPTICYKNGKLTFNSATEGATCLSSITDTDIASYSSNEVQLSATYKISVYATKTGYSDSETVTATLCWIDVEPKTEGITNDIANVPAKAVLIQTNGGSINVQGCDDGEQVGVYSTNGAQVGSAVSQNGVATVNTTLQSGSIAIIKVGEKSVKVIMK